MRGLTSCVQLTPRARSSRALCACSQAPTSTPPPPPSPTSASSGRRATLQSRARPAAQQPNPCLPTAQHHHPHRHRARPHPPTPAGTLTSHLPPPPLHYHSTTTTRHPWPRRRSQVSTGVPWFCPLGRFMPVGPASLVSPEIRLPGPTGAALAQQRRAWCAHGWHRGARAGSQRARCAPCNASSRDALRPHINDALLSGTSPAHTGGSFISCFYPDGVTDGACAAGTYGGTPRETTASCTAYCTPGHYCDQGTGEPTPCPTGSYMPVSGASFEGACLPCAPGRSPDPNLSALSPLPFCAAHPSLASFPRPIRASFSPPTTGGAQASSTTSAATPTPRAAHVRPGASRRASARAAAPRALQATPTQHPNPRSHLALPGGIRTFRESAPSSTCRAD